jgi:hypothetical protein
MQEPLTGLLLTRAEYQSLASAAHREPLFPSWAQWNKLQMRAAGYAMTRGIAAAPWTIDIPAFHRWCASVGATPCIDELRNYALTAGAKRPWPEPQFNKEPTT